MATIINSIYIEFDNVSSPLIGRNTKGFEKLYTIYESIFIESIGQENYNNEIKDALKTRIFLQIWSSFNYVMKYCQ